MPDISFKFDRNYTLLDNHHLNFSNLLIDIFQEITGDHQLIIQIDDLQWIDSTSLTPILLATSYISKNLLIISTTRQHLIEDEPLINQLYKEKGIPTPRLKKSFKHLNIHLIELNGIKEEGIIDQVEALLSYTTSEAKSVAGILKKKTEGNPLHIQQQLVSFKEKNILWFDTQKNEWTWQLSELE